MRANLCSDLSNLMFMVPEFYGMEKSETIWHVLVLTSENSICVGSYQYNNLYTHEDVTVKRVKYVI